MAEEVAIDAATGRKYFLEAPDDLRADEEVVFVLNLHGGGSHGTWQRLYFPAFALREKYRLVIATPSAATKEPFRMWVGEADDAHLRNIVDAVVSQIGAQRIRAFWLVGHSQGGMTSNRLLFTDYFADRVDGWLSLSGGRIGAIETPPGFGPGGQPVNRDALARLGTIGGEPRRPGQGVAPKCDLSFIFATGELEIVALPETSPWAEKYGAGPRQRLPDIVDAEPGLIYDTLRDGRSTPAWGLKARPGVAQIYLFPGARGGRVIADVVRLDKGHTEGLEPKVTEALVKLMVSAPGGKLRAL